MISFLVGYGVFTLATAVVLGLIVWVESADWPDLAEAPETIDLTVPLPVCPICGDAVRDAGWPIVGDGCDVCVACWMQQPIVIETPKRSA